MFPLQNIVFPCWWYMVHTQPLSDYNIRPITISFWRPRGLPAGAAMHLDGPMGTTGNYTSPVHKGLAKGALSEYRLSPSIPSSPPIPERSIYQRVRVWSIYVHAPCKTYTLRKVANRNLNVSQWDCIVKHKRFINYRTTTCEPNECISLWKPMQTNASMDAWDQVKVNKPLRITIQNRSPKDGPTDNAARPSGAQTTRNDLQKTT